jgi:DNA-binding beta-propeller fold protein YncE
MKITLVKPWKVETVAASGGANADYELSGTSIPAGIAIAGGKIYVADMGAYQIKRKDLASAPEVDPFSFAGAESPGSGEGINTAALFNSPQAIVIKNSSPLTFYVADSGKRASLQGAEVVTGNHRIIQITISEDGDKQVRLLAGSPDGDSGDVDGTGSDARFKFPSGLALDGNTLYVADTENNKIKKINIANQEVSTLDLTGASLPLKKPSGLALDGSGNLYVAEAGGNRISKITLSTGDISVCAGAGTAGYKDSPYPFIAQFREPAGLAYHDGSLFVADMGNYCVRRVNLTTQVVSTLAGYATVNDPETDPPGWFENGIGTTAKFTRPIGIAVYNGDVYVTDAFSPEAPFLVRKLTAIY